MGGRGVRDSLYADTASGSVYGVLCCKLVESVVLHRLCGGCEQGGSRGREGVVKLEAPSRSTVQVVGGDRSVPVGILVGLQHAHNVTCM